MFLHIGITFKAEKSIDCYVATAVNKTDLILNTKRLKYSCSLENVRKCGNRKRIGKGMIPANYLEKLRVKSYVERNLSKLDIPFNGKRLIVYFKLLNKTRHITL